MLIEYMNACRGTEPMSSRLEGLRRWGRVGLTGGGVGGRPPVRWERCLGPSWNSAPFAYH